MANIVSSAYSYRDGGYYKASDNSGPYAIDSTGAASLFSQPRTAYETVAASQTAQVLGGAGATGDYVESLICVVATAATSTVTLLDNATSIAVLPANVGGGVGTYVIRLGMASVSGPWKVTTGAGVSVIATGNFT